MEPAALNCLTGRFPEAISNLNEAIRLNPANRYQARNDSDFKNLADDPRFTELLYPDTSGEAPAEPDKWRFLAANRRVDHARLSQLRRHASPSKLLPWVAAPVSRPCFTG